MTAHQVWTWLRALFGLLAFIVGLTVVALLPQHSWGVYKSWEVRTFSSWQECHRFQPRIQQNFSKWLLTCLRPVNFQSPRVIVLTVLSSLHLFCGERIWWNLRNHWSPSCPFCQVWDFILPHIQCLLLFDGFWQKTQNWIRKNVLLLMTQQAALFSVYLQWFLLLRSPLGVAWGPSRCYTCSGSVSHLRNTELKESTTFRASSKLACSLWRATVPHISWLPTECCPEKWLR